MRDGLLVWLREALDIMVISPEPGARYDAVIMQASGVRRTAHAHEDGTVAKVERIGLRNGEQVLFRAQVLRYELGAGY
jgi:molecular chaperone GrpE (heat shock protein)